MKKSKRCCAFVPEPIYCTASKKLYDAVRKREMEYNDQNEEWLSELRNCARFGAVSYA